MSLILADRSARVALSGGRLLDVIDGTRVMVAAQRPGVQPPAPGEDIDKSNPTAKMPAILKSAASGAGRIATPCLTAQALDWTVRDRLAGLLPREPQGTG